MVAGLAQRLADRITAGGPLRFDEYCEAALYDPLGGFYTAGRGRAGRREGDFLTSPEVGPLFGAVLARALGGWWDEAGRPDPFVVVEVAAGRGVLARALLGAGGPWASVLRLVTIERSPVLRSMQAELLAEAVERDDGAALDTPLAGSGPAVRLLADVGDLPARLRGVVVANEWLDNIPVRLFQRVPSAWAEVVVEHRGETGFAEALVPADPSVIANLDGLAPEAEPGHRVPFADGATAVVAEVAGRLDRGRLVLIDYGDTTPSLARRSPDEWLRTYRAHGPGGDPLADPGSKDITCEVPFDQIETVLAGARRQSQVEFLRRHGLDELVAEGRRVWHERASIGDLEALRARSRVREAEALTDPDGLGAFWVLEWSSRDEAHAKGRE